MNISLPFFLPVSAFSSCSWWRAKALEFRFTTWAMFLFLHSELAVPHLHLSQHSKFADLQGQQPTLLFFFYYKYSCKNKSKRRTSRVKRWFTERDKAKLLYQRTLISLYSYNNQFTNLPICQDLKCSRCFQMELPVELVRELQYSYTQLSLSRIYIYLENNSYLRSCKDVFLHEQNCYTIQISLI